MTEADPRQKVILFLHQKLHSFVAQDLRTLRSAYETREIRYRNILDFFAILLGMLQADMCFCWFGKLHSFFAVFIGRIMRKPVIVVAGGDDVACVPEIGYGMFCYRHKSWCPRFVFKHCDKILLFSKSSLADLHMNLSDLETHTEVIHLGFSADVFRRCNSATKQKRAILVSTVDKEYLTRKGVEIFALASTFLPTIRFDLVGDIGDPSVAAYLRAATGTNFIIHGRLPEKDLIELLSISKVYVQASMHEGFGCALAEAMLCECIPVVSRKGSIPEVVGDFGVYLDTLTPENLASKIEYALRLPNTRGTEARRWIANAFPAEKRRTRILKTIREAIG